MQIVGTCAEGAGHLGIDVVNGATNDLGERVEGVALEVVELPSERLVVPESLFQRLGGVVRVEPAVELGHVERTDAAAATCEHPEIVVDHQEVGPERNEMANRVEDIVLKVSVQGAERVLVSEVGSPAETLERRGRVRHPAVPHRRLDEHAGLESLGVHGVAVRHELLAEDAGLVIGRNALGDEREAERGLVEVAFRREFVEIRDDLVDGIREQRSDIDKVEFHVRF